MVSAPIKDGGALNLVYGVNHDLYDPATPHLVTAASCTTNCLAPVVKVTHEGIGIRRGSIIMIHDVTNTQTIVERPAKDLRCARSALLNLIPTTTGSATAITLVYPELKGRLNGHAVRGGGERAFPGRGRGPAPRHRGLRDPRAGVLGFSGDRRSAVIDAQSTMVVNGTQVKVYAWYNNEWGYACRLADIVRMVAGSL